MNTRSINRKMRCLGTLAAFLGLGLIANTASADILLAKQNKVGQAHTAASLLDLNGTVAGKQTIVPFSTTAPNRLVRVIFNAEGVVAGGPGNTLDSTIIIDPAGPVGPVACAPSDDLNNAFVSGNGTATPGDGWASAVTQCFYRIPTAGVHTVRVLMTPIPRADWSIDDLSLVID